MVRCMTRNKGTRAAPLIRIATPTVGKTFFASGGEREQVERTEEVALSRTAFARRRNAGFRPVLLLVLLAALVFALPRDRGAGAGQRREGAAADPEPAPAAPAPTLLPVSDLIYRVPAKIRESCTPVDTRGHPVEMLHCSDDLTRAFYLRYADVAALDAQFDAGIAPLNLPERPGGCREGQPSRETWRYTPTREIEQGRMACFIMPPDIPVTVLTQPQARLLTVVVSNPVLGWTGHFERWAAMVPQPTSGPVTTSAPEG